MKALFRKELGRLVPDDRLAEEALAKVAHGDVLNVEWTRPRRPRPHRLFWALCGIVADNTDRYRDAEHVARMFKVATGHCDEEHRKPTKADLAFAERCDAARRKTNDPDITDCLQEAAERARSGGVVYVPRSIAFAKMGQDEFSAFLDRCIQLVCSAIIPNLPESDLRAELENMTQERAA